MVIKEVVIVSWDIVYSFGRTFQVIGLFG